MSYSDDGEDLDILRRYPIDYQGTAVEVGAGDGKVLSNTLLLEEKGWNVLCIEPNPDLGEALKARRKNVRLCGCLDHEGEEDFYSYFNPGGAHHEVIATVGDLEESFRAVFGRPASREAVIRKVRVATLDSLIESWEHRDPIDFISIDVDGREPEVLKGLDFDRWKPRYMLIEDVKRGHGPTEIEKIMYERGYFSIGVYGWNVLYAHPAIDGNPLRASHHLLGPMTWRQV